MPQDALVVKYYANRTDEYVETSDWLNLIEVQRSPNHLASDYHWWDCRSHHYDNRDIYDIRQAVVL